MHFFGEVLKRPSANAAKRPAANGTGGNSKKSKGSEETEPAAATPDAEQGLCVRSICKSSPSHVFDVQRHPAHDRGPKIVRPLFYKKLNTWALKMDKKQVLSVSWIMIMHHT